MVRFSLKRMKVVQRKTPSGKTVSHYRRKAYSKHICAICRKELHGMLKGSPHVIKGATKSQRRPSRPYGGQLCPACTARVISMKAKLKFKVIDEKQVPLSMKAYVMNV